MIPPAIKYLRARAHFYVQIPTICKKLRRSVYPMMCKHADKMQKVSLLCQAQNDCDKCGYVEECGARADALMKIG